MSVFVCLCARVSVCLSACLSVFLPVYLSVCAHACVCAHASDSPGSQFPQCNPLKLPTKAVSCADRCPTTDTQRVPRQARPPGPDVNQHHDPLPPPLSPLPGENFLEGKLKTLTKLLPDPLPDHGQGPASSSLTKAVGRSKPKSPKDTTDDLADSHKTTFKHVLGLFELPSWNARSSSFIQYSSNRRTRRFVRRPHSPYEEYRRDLTRLGFRNMKSSHRYRQNRSVLFSSRVSKRSARGRRSLPEGFNQHTTTFSPPGSTSDPDAPGRVPPTSTRTNTSLTSVECYCDPQCPLYGDCCADYFQLCLGKNITRERELNEVLMDCSDISC